MRHEYGMRGRVLWVVGPRAVCTEDNGVEWGRGRQQSTINFIQNIESLSSKCCTPCRCFLIIYTPPPHPPQSRVVRVGDHAGAGEKIDIEC